MRTTQAPLRPAWGRIVGLVLVLAALAILLRHAPVTGLDLLGALLMGTGIGLATLQPTTTAPTAARFSDPSLSRLDRLDGPR